MCTVLLLCVPSYVPPKTLNLFQALISTRFRKYEAVKLSEKLPEELLVEASGKVVQT